MKKFLITGGAGFIGSAVIRYLINNTQHQVINLDKLTYAGNLDNLAEVSSNERYTFEQVDICDTAAVKRVLQQHQPNIIMHLAAESHVDRSIDGPAAFIETNILGTYTLLEAARNYWNALPKAEQRNFRFHHVSTDEVYGDLPHPDDKPHGASPFVQNSSVGARSSCDQSTRSYKELITHVADRPGHDRRYAIDANKIEQELGWKPKETFETGLRKTVQWYLDNETWWQNVLSGNYQLTRLGSNK